MYHLNEVSIFRTRIAQILYTLQCITINSWHLSLFKFLTMIYLE